MEMMEASRNISTEGFRQLRRRWKQTLTGGRADLSAPDVIFTLKRLSDTAERLLTDIEPSHLHIWPDLSPIHLSVNFRKSFERLRTIAQSYSVNGSVHHDDLNVQETIVQSLDFITSEIYNSSCVPASGENWWNYRIGAPLPLMDIAIMLYDDLGPRRRHEYGATVVKMVGGIHHRTLKGANRADICYALIGAGVLTDDEHQVSRGRWGLSDRDMGGGNSIFTLVETGEGFYEGGSYISHEIFPYSGGYGVQHLLSLSKTVSILHKSFYEINQTDLAVTYDAIETTFIPVMWRGMMMAHVRGRDIARKPENDAFWGNLFLQSLLYFCEFAPDSYSKKFRALARSIYESAPLPDLQGLNITQAIGIQNIINEGIPAASPPIGTFVTPMSDRVIHHRQHWAAALAMSSTRIGRYEALNGENLKPWYQGDGFLYIYTDAPTDLAHWQDDYWPTMDPYHSPGVTNGQNPQAPPAYKFTAYKDWAGGLDWRGAYGLAGLDAFANDKGSAAKKSWFFLLNSVIALGAGCIGSSGTELHTTIESRIMPLQGRNLSINGMIQQIPSVSKAWEETRKDADWAHLENVGGYVFLDKDSVTFKQERRKGKWTDIDQYADYRAFDELVTKNYLTIFRNHGVDPGAASYAYALLPSSSVEETKAFAIDPQIYIDRNTPTLQAIKFNYNNTVMANFWSPGTIGHLTAVTPCAVAFGFRNVTDRFYTISVSDPTHRATRLVLFVNDPDLGGLSEKDASIKVHWSRPGMQGPVTITVNTEKSHGKTHRLSFERISWRETINESEGKGGGEGGLHRRAHLHGK